MSENTENYYTVAEGVAEYRLDKDYRVTRGLAQKLMRICRDNGLKYKTIQSEKSKSWSHSFINVYPAKAFEILINKRCE